MEDFVEQELGKGSRKFSMKNLSRWTLLDSVAMIYLLLLTIPFWLSFTNFLYIQFYQHNLIGHIQHDFYINYEIGLFLESAITMVRQKSWSNTETFIYWTSSIGCLAKILMKSMAVNEESVLILSGMGIQLDSTSLIGSKTSIFIPLEDLKDVIISEGIRRWSVIFYMTIITRTNHKIIVLFETSLPRLHILERVYIHVQNVLFNGQD
ncbi:GPI-GlcNAc transferase complex, PIG-H component-domain-containing protein [Globomyces pollinis-pini]|nr:GPI-GlcNAc transferase complex, PIG-H component-domain-containing protein [Globomyces pollinis-pini]